MKILLVGGTGLIGSLLKKELIKRGYEVNILSRKVNNYSQTYLWNVEDKFIDINALKGISGIINLSGANIAEKRWTTKRKQDLYDSRINSTKLLYETVKNNNIKIDFFINASAIGYYGYKKSNHVFKECDPSGKDFLSRLCDDWEKEALNFNSLNIRTVLIRTGIVLTKSNGAFEKMKKPILYGFCPILGDGKQYIPWIHIDDLIGIYIRSIENSQLKDCYNAVAPEHINYMELNNEIAEVSQKKVVTFKIPNLVLKIIFGDLANLITNGNKISSKKIILEGYQFKYPTLKSAIVNLIEK